MSAGPTTASVAAVEGGAGVGIAGCGFVAAEHHVEAIATAGSRVAAAYDTDRDAAVRLAQRAGAAAVSGSLDDLLSRRDLGAVAICTPPSLHPDGAIAALECGHDVIVEKPVAVSLDAATEMIEARERSGRRAAVGFNLRAHAVLSGCRRAIRAGAIGDPVMLTHTWVGPAHLATSGWIADPSRGGSLTLERGSHCIDTARFLTGAEITAVAATGVADEAVSLELELEGPGGMGILAAATMAVGPVAVNRLRCTGTSGTIECDLYAFDGLRTYIPGALPGSVAERVKGVLASPARLPGLARAARGNGVFRESYAQQWSRFLGSADAEARDLASLEDGRAALAAALAAIASRTEGRTIAIADGPRDLAEAGAVTA